MTSICFILVDPTLKKTLVTYLIFVSADVYSSNFDLLKKTFTRLSIHSWSYVLMSLECLEVSIKQK